MNIFSWLLIPFVFYLFFTFRADFKRPTLVYALIAALATATLIFIIEFFISWGSVRSVLPTFGKLFLYALKRESLVPLIISLLAFWLFRGSLWDKNNHYSFSANFIFFGIIFFIIGLGENLYNRFDSDFYQIICAPIIRLSMALVASYLLTVAESLNFRVGALLLGLSVLVYGALTSLGYGFFYSRMGIYLLPVMAFVIIVPLLLYLFLPREYGARGLLS